ncbi:hypothetical protein F5B20DRAFT_483490 [Whalleya microplaca]|nr:hypothetical protein F5B20DRAFT_483490 [Whalleya microplaca]
MAYKLHIPPCICDPAHPNHPPPKDKPLRIQIEGPLVSIQRLLPESTWDMDFTTDIKFPQPAGPHLARLTHQVLYGEDISVDDMVVRDEYLGVVMIDKIPQSEFDYYGVTFDHLVPPDDLDPEVLQVNIMELEIDQGPYAGGIEYANKYLNITVDPADYLGKKDTCRTEMLCQKEGYSRPWQSERIRRLQEWKDDIETWWKI